MQGLEYKEASVPNIQQHVILTDVKEENPPN